MRYGRLASFSVGFALLCAVSACASGQSGNAAGAGGGAAAGGSAGTGPSASGGTSATGGGTGTGANSGTGGVANTGGTTNTGGMTNTGGTTNTGGVANTGGTAGTGGTHVVGSCDNLPAANTWEKISPTGTVVETKSFALDPFDSGIVWANNEHGLNKSTDCGATWTLVSTGRNGPGLANSSLWSMAIDPVDRGTIYVVGGYGALGLWKSTNGGVDWDGLVEGGTEYAKVQQYRFVNNISMDPKDHLHLAFATHGGCDAPYAPNCDGETFDGGKTIKLTIAPSGWPEGGGLFVVDKTTWLWSDPFGGIWRTTDNAATFQKVRTNGYGGNGEFTTTPLVPASDGAYYLTSIGGILRSTDKGATWTQVHGGRWVGFAMSSTTLYAADQWSPTFASAKISDPSKWTTFAPPPGLPSNQGAPFLAYDEDHHLLFASTWPGGLWRIVMP